MVIRELDATFGKLKNRKLVLKDGLNVICAPNESGKSTWSRFIRNMLYGVSTRDRSAQADKNRFAPWSGALMSGRMDVTSGDESSTLLRQTRRASAPMGEFSCTYAGTDTAVPGIAAGNAGEQLLGITPEVFAKCERLTEQYRDRVVFGGGGDRETLRFGPTVIKLLSVAIKAAVVS